MDRFDTYPEGKKDREFVNQCVENAAEELKKAAEIIIEAAKDKTIKDVS